MKFIAVLALTLSMVLVFASCKPQPPAVISSGKTFELATDKDGNALYDSSGKPIAVIREGNEERTEPLSEKYLIVSDDKIMAPAYELEVPEDFDIKASNADPLLENKKGTVQINIMDKTDTAGDFDEYIVKTAAYMASISSEAGELEDVTVAGLPMQRMGFKTADDSGEALDVYCYFARVNGRALMITVTSKNGGVGGAAEADELVAKMDFTK